MSSMEQVVSMLERAVFDSTVMCPNCEYEPLEPDYETCPECGKKNPLKEWGMI